MTTLDTVLLIILTVLIGLFFLVGIFVLAAVIKLIGSVRRVVDRAEEVIVSVESATEVFRDTGGKLAFFKLVRNIIKLAKKHSK